MSSSTGWGWWSKKVCIAVTILSITPTLSARDQKTETAIAKAKAWLQSQQQADGSWLPREQPAVTAIVLRSCRGEWPGADGAAAADKGFGFLLQNLHPDGGIYGGTNYQNYNTSWSVLAFAESDRPERKRFIARARPLMVSWQMDLDQKGRVDNPFDGGIGYGDGTPRANLANTLVPLEALYLSKSYGARGEPKLDRDMLVEFLHRSQNLSSVNEEPWVLEDEPNRGGFIYHPGRSMAGETKSAEGKSGYRSYGSMTFAGLLSSFYVGVNKNDPAIKGAFDWLERHFSVEENPGIGKDGLFNYYALMAKTFSTYKVRTFKTADGRKIDWRAALTNKLLELQRPDGSWVNSQERWLENNPVLCTAYALMALNAIEGRR